MWLRRAQGRRCCCSTAGHSTGGAGAGSSSGSATTTACSRRPARLRLERGARHRLQRHRVRQRCSRPPGRPRPHPRPCGRPRLGRIRGHPPRITASRAGRPAAVVQYAGPWARPSPSIVAGLRRAWYAGLVATPILGERVVRHPRFVPWFLRLGGQAALFSDEDAAHYAEQFRDPGRAAAASRLYRYYLQTAREVLCDAPTPVSGCAIPAAVRRRRLLHPARAPAEHRGSRRRPYPRGRQGLQSLDAGGAPRPHRREGPGPVWLTMPAVRRSSCIRLQILVPSAPMKGSTLAAASWRRIRSTPSSSAHRSSGAAIGLPRQGSCQVPTDPRYRTQVRGPITQPCVPQPQSVRLQRVRGIVGRLQAGHPRAGGRAGWRGGHDRLLHLQPAKPRLRPGPVEGACRGGPAGVRRT